MTREESRKRNEAMKAYKAEGHSIGEVAERFGVSEGLASNVCKGIAPQTQRRPKRYNNQYSSQTEKAEAAKIKRINKTVQENAPGFEYAGGYTDGNGSVLLRCKTCGQINAKAWTTVRHAKILGKNIRCEVCYRAALETAQAERAKAKEEEKAARIQLKRRNIVAKQIAMEIKTCKECGAVFIANKSTLCYCSEECRRKANNNHHDRRLKGKVTDRDITLEKLYKRDGGVCYLCGGMCDWTDIEDRDGVLIAGDMYPSIDHVTPLAHEGKHGWDNVRLAHRRCNYLKSDNPPAPKAV